MAHPEQQEWCKKVKERFPAHFNGVKVLDIGSLDVNGNNRYLFEDCDYTGVDVAEGPNVDVVSLGHELAFPDETFDTIITTEVFEHDMFYEQTMQNIVRMLRSGGLFLFTCATKGRREHGTLRSDGGFSSPLTVKFPGWENYYKNIEREDVERAISMDLFSDYDYGYNYIYPAIDIYFYGIKK